MPEAGELAEMCQRGMWGFAYLLFYLNKMLSHKHEEGNPAWLSPSEEVSSLGMFICCL